jgi:hypothetical protein
MNALSDPVVIRVFPSLKAGLVTQPAPDGGANDNMNTVLRKIPIDQWSARRFRVPIGIIKNEIMETEAV